MLKLPDAVASWQAWLHAGEFLLTAAKYPTDEAIAGVTDQIDRALFLPYQEDMGAKPR